MTEFYSRTKEPIKNGGMIAILRWKEKKREGTGPPKKGKKFKMRRKWSGGWQGGGCTEGGSRSKKKCRGGNGYTTAVPIRNKKDSNRASERSTWKPEEKNPRNYNQGWARAQKKGLFTKGAEYLKTTK